MPNNWRMINQIWYNYVTTQSTERYRKCQFMEIYICENKVRVEHKIINTYVVMYVNKDWKRI